MIPQIFKVKNPDIEILMAKAGEPETLRNLKEHIEEAYALLKSGQIELAERLYRHVRQQYHELPENERSMVYKDCIELHKALLQKKMDELQILLDKWETSFSVDIQKRFEDIYWGMGTNELKSPRFANITDKYAKLLEKYLQS